VHHSKLSLPGGEKQIENLHGGMGESSRVSSPPSRDSKSHFGCPTVTTGAVLQLGRYAEQEEIPVTLLEKFMQFVVNVEERKKRSNFVSEE
jgi:hypothetical protein